MKWIDWGILELAFRDTTKKPKKAKKKSQPIAGARWRNTPGRRIAGRDIPQGKKMSFGKHDMLKRGL